MLVEGVIGEDNGFYREYGFYVHGVGTGDGYTAA
jgi:hypothetical protein